MQWTLICKLHYDSCSMHIKESNSKLTDQVNYMYAHDWCELWYYDSSSVAYQLYSSLGRYMVSFAADFWII